MRLVLTERFQRDAGGLSAEARAALLATILGLSQALGEPHRHSGLGIRKLHSSGIFEARIGLGLRLVFTLETDFITLVRVGTHDEILRFLREL